jgi:hypothetical protein
MLHIWSTFLQHSKLTYKAMASFDNYPPTFQLSPDVFCKVHAAQVQAIALSKVTRVASHRPQLVQPQQQQVVTLHLLHQALDVVPG